MCGWVRPIPTLEVRHYRGLLVLGFEIFLNYISVLLYLVDARFFVGLNVPHMGYDNKCRGGVMAAAADSKSAVLRGMRVRLPLSAQERRHNEYSRF